MAKITTNKAVLTELLAIKGAHILDIGSGAGGLVRFLTRQGGRVSGLECGAAQLEKARSAPPAGDETFVEGFAQKLPFEDAIFDTAIFFNSLHHVPVEEMAGALIEAARVIKPGGMIYVAEPIAAGSGHELSAPVDDETAVRAAAYKCVQSATDEGLTEIREVHYDTVYHYENFAAFKEEMIRIEPGRLAPFEAMEADLRVDFARLGVADEKGVRFDQPMRVNLLEKPGA